MVDSIFDFCVLDAENYRLDTEYENHLIYKVALVMRYFDNQTQIMNVVLVSSILSSSKSKMIPSCAFSKGDRLSFPHENVSENFLLLRYLGNNKKKKRKN